MKIGICSIIKDEHQYLDEWIQYHLNIGFTDIFLYEDYKSVSHKDICDKYENVVLKPITDITDEKLPYRQIEMNKNFSMNNNAHLDWCAFIDVDEFIRFDDNYNMERFLKEFDDVNCVYLFWKTYGAAKHISKPEGNVFDNYVWSNPNLLSHPNYSFKSFVHLNGHKYTNWKSNHQYVGGVKPNHQNIREDERIIEPVFMKCWIEHFFTKSWEEWVWKIQQRGDLVPGNRKVLDFFHYNKDLLPRMDELLNMYDIKLNPYEYERLKIK